MNANGFDLFIWWLTIVVAFGTIIAVDKDAV